MIHEFFGDFWHVDPRAIQAENRRNWQFIKQSVEISSQQNL